MLIINRISLIIFKIQASLKGRIALEHTLNFRPDLQLNTISNR